MTTTNATIIAISQGLSELIFDAVALCILVGTGISVGAAEPDIREREKKRSDKTCVTGINEGVKPLPIRLSQS